MGNCNLLLWVWKLIAQFPGKMLCCQNKTTNKNSETWSSWNWKLESGMIPDPNPEQVLLMAFYNKILEMLHNQVTFVLKCKPWSARMLLKIPKIVDLCVINRVESANISCLHMYDLLLSNDHGVQNWKFDVFLHKLLSSDTLLPIVQRRKQGKSHSIVDFKWPVLELLLN